MEYGSLGLYMSHSSPFPHITPSSSLTLLPPPPSSSLTSLPLLPPPPSHHSLILPHITPPSSLLLPHITPSSSLTSLPPPPSHHSSHFSMGRNKEAEQWCSLSMKYMEHLSSFKESYQHQVPGIHIYTE